MRLPSYAATICLSAALVLPVMAQNPAPDTRPPEVKAVLDYVLKSDYPEVYNKKPYRIQLNGYALGDVDGDGAVEVFLLVDAHYQQTPTILIFRVTKNGAVQRLMEGLAPGPLVPINGKRLDAHTLGVALDATVGKNEKPGKLLEVARAMVKSKDACNLVVYRNFFHADMPDNSRSFLDMTDHAEFPDADKCEGFQFSKPSDIEVGTLTGVTSKPQLAVLVGRECYLYRITKITADGFLEKQVTRIPCPDGATRIIRTADGNLAFRFDDPKTPDKALTLP